MKTVRYFLALAETLNFTQAAAQCHITQTAMSRQIANLEDRLQVQLFQRTSHAVTLTEAGRTFYEGMKQLASEYEELEAKTRAVSRKYTGYLRVGIGLYEYQHTEEFLTKFMQANPEIKVDIYQYSYGELSARLKSGDLDVLIGLDYCESAFRPGEVDSRLLFEQDNVLVIRRDLLRKHPQKTAESVLQTETLVTNCEDSGPSSMDMLRNLLKRTVGFVPGDIVQTNSIGAQLLLVNTGHGAAVVPEFLREIRNPALAVLRMPGDNTQRYRIIRLKENANPAARLMVAFAK